MPEQRIGRAYEPASVESRIYQAWEDTGAFACDPDSAKDPFVVMMPPPNVTGSLHIGHALNMTLQDVLSRYWRMRGRDVLWQPGSDHAGIATQMVVERQLADECGPDRKALGREAFVERVWAWKRESGGTINRQLRRLGASADWSRERFTLDEGLSAAVRQVFVRLHREGLIYRDKRLVNWDTQLRTAISDLEVDTREVKGGFWYIRYPFADGDGHVTVATTRPETMLGDTCVAVHPEDPRTADFVGRDVRLPLTDRVIPVVADAYVDPEKGTGAVKITPAHDFNDFEVGRRHDQPPINILNADGTLNANVPAVYRDLDRFEARKRVVADLDAAGLLEREEEIVHTVPFGDRSQTVIEPWLTDQWFVDAKTLAGPAIQAVEEGRTRFVPANWANTYFEWMRNIQPWCISRQLWWGHRIPAWYGPDGTVFVAESEAEAMAAAEQAFGKPVPLAQDADVLDTWFSSGLWPFSTLDWPARSDLVGRYYPGTVLVTGFDIIFFWVARMMMMGLHLQEQVPFRDVYIHALVRDAKGRKMSKSEGNVIDPLELMDRYGTDAVRFTLVAMAAQGRDIRLAEDRVKGYRNFVTKLWNAARFLELQGAGQAAPAARPAPALSLNRWIEAEAARAAEAVGAAIEAYRFDEAAAVAYQFLWHTYCDWYLELAKSLLAGSDAAARTETQASAAAVFAQVLRMLHPIMPFVTEELWSLRQETGRLLALTPWPDQAPAPDPEARGEIEWLMAFVSEVRSVRSELRVPQAAAVGIRFRSLTPEAERALAVHGEAMRRLARIESFAADEGQVTEAAELEAAGTVALMPLAGTIDIAAERTRLGKELDALRKDIARFEAKLANPSFVDRAPPAVVQEQRDRKTGAIVRSERIERALARLGTGMEAA